MRLPISAVWGNRFGKGVIVAVVACAVGGTGYLAGHGGASAKLPPDPLPKADLSPHVISAEQGPIVSRLNVDATIRSDTPVDVRPDGAGTVTAVFRKAGQAVSKGDAIAAYKTGGGQPAGPAPKGKQQPAAPKPVTKMIRASVTGVLSSMSTGVNQSVSPDAAVAQIDQGKFRAVATIDPKDVYKLYTKPRELRLAVDHGPAPFLCSLIAYGAGAGSAVAPDSGTQGTTGSSGSQGNNGPGKFGPGPGPGSNSGSGGGDSVEVACRIPDDQKVFGGIKAKMAITTDSAENAVLVPLSAVLGEAQTGRITVVGPDGSRKVRTVKLGITDGTKIQIVNGLDVGEKLLDRAPEDPAFNAPGNGGGPNGGPNGGPPDGGGPPAMVYPGGGG